VTFPAGTEAYRTDVNPIQARGITFSADELEKVVEAASEVAWDRPGKEELGELLASVASTEFESEGVEAILSSDETSIEDWRAGEAVAQAHLAENIDCFFPWGSRRDLKNPLASPAGAELVGFDRRQNPTRLALGEVKTSRQEQAPPTVVHGEDGLNAQLVAIRDEKTICQNVLRWLGFRAEGAEWVEDYKSAASRFLANPKDVSAFGVLVRTVDPDANDLRLSAEHLAPDTEEPISIGLEAVYVAEDTLKAIAEPPGTDS